MRRVSASKPGRPRTKQGKLSHWLDARGMTRYELARQLDVDRAHVDKLCRGERRPSLDLALAIAKLTGGEVSVESWAQTAKHSHD